VKPSRFDYERPADLAGAIALIRREDIAVKMLAGGQSLGPMLNLRLAQPDLLVDITAIPELKRVEEAADGILVGACITHADIEDGRVPDVTGGALPGVARGISYRAVRNRGTIGGSLAHADPSADWVSCLAAVGAEVLIRGPAGQRSLAIADFVTGVFEVALEAGEIVEAVRIPRLSRHSRWGYYKICRKTGELAQAIGAFLHDPDRRVSRAVVGTAESTPVVISDATSLFAGNPPPHPDAFDPRAFDPQAAARALDAAGLTDPLDRQIRIAALKRAIGRAARA
jgi:aerobic carbon-monoxide dehydrogenase medium subunit